MDGTGGQDTYDDVGADDHIDDVNNGVTMDDTSEALEDQLGLTNDSTEILAHITKRLTLPQDHNIWTLLASTHNCQSVNNTQLPIH